MNALGGKTSLHVIIDGYNLIRNVPALAQFEGRSLQDGRDHLIARAAAYHAATGHRVTIVFDGPAPSMDSRRGIAVCYAHPADDDIIRRSSPGCVIVSSDHAVADGARMRGAQAMRSDEFWDLATRHQGVAAPSKRRGAGRKPAPASGSGYGSYDKDADEDDDTQRSSKRGPAKRLSRSEREADERRRRLRNLL